MTIGVDLAAAERLMEAAQAFNRPTGEGLVSSERSPVPRELAESFRALMEAPEPQNSPDSLPIGRPDGVNAIEGAERAERAVEPSLHSQGIEKTASSAEGLMSPTELYRIQFSVNMHVFETKFATHVRDSAASRVDEMLRTTG